jgi:hypothetical protein
VVQTSLVSRGATKSALDAVTITAVDLSGRLSVRQCG